MSMTAVGNRERAYAQASSASLGLGTMARFALARQARQDAKKNIPFIAENQPVDWATVPTWLVELSNATKLARMTVLGLLVANRAELREYDALRSRLRVEQELRVMRHSLGRDEEIERARRITRNVTSIERQIPRLESFLTNSVREATSWGEVFFDAADQRIAHYWRELRRRHPQGDSFGRVPPTFPRPNWLSNFALADLLTLQEEGVLPGDNSDPREGDA